ncbi:MAG: LysE family translocator, partial [Actinomycetota bacterium]|nr:LysE family translocator [Actinomycetota bacterium]
MPDVGTLAVFAAAALALLVVPGPAVLYIVAQSADRGRAAGLVSMLGVQAGAAVHVAAAAVGLSSLLVSSALAFEIVKYVGAAYLVFLGIRRLVAGEELGERGDPRLRSLRRLFAQGVVVNVLNPKTALFFFAFLPQFVDPDAGFVPGQIALLGACWIALAIMTDGAYAVLAGTAAGWLRGTRGYLRAQRYVSATVFI